jgi:hypothetical protein
VGSAGAGAGAGGGAVAAAWAAAAAASALAPRGLRTRFSATSPESLVFSDKLVFLAKRRALAVRERGSEEGFRRVRRLQTWRRVQRN